jgi:streptogramin lyase
VPRPASVLLAAVGLVAACAPSSPSASPATTLEATPTATESPEANPFPTSAGTQPALVIDLGPQAAPIGSLAAFDSIWVANHHSDDVVRIDPVTATEIARFEFGYGSGPAYLTATEDAVWVTRQNSRGMGRIDPATNDIVTLFVGEGPPCGPTAAGAGAVWYYACDDETMVRIDPATEEVRVIPAEGLAPPLVVDDVVYSSSSTEVVRLDPTTETWVSVGGCCGSPIAYAVGSLWLGRGAELVRVDIATGQVTATLPIGPVDSLAPVGDHAWLTVHDSTELTEIDLTTNQVLGTLPVGPTPVWVIHAFDYLWLTDFDTDKLWRIESPA